MTTASPTPVSPTPASLKERFTGRVKWFNNKAGYGFITVTDGPKTGTDIFVHHSSIKVDAEQYKYLVQGEYTEFELSTVAGSAHECQSSEVSGIKGGKLMCETRYDARSTRTTYKDQGQDPSPTTKRPARQAPKVENDTVVPATSEWTPARKPRQQVAPSEARPMSSAGRGPTTGGRGAAGRGPTTGGRGRGAKRT